MLAKPKKISRKKVKEDKLVTFYSKTLEFYEKFQTKIIIVVGVVAVVILAMVLYSNKLEQDNLTATTQLSRVISLYESGSYQEAIDGTPGTDVVGLKQIVDEYGSTEQGEVAKIYLANSLVYLEKIDEALEVYNDYSGSNNLFKAAALAGKAGCYASKGEFEKAADYYEDAANVSETNASNPDYLLKAGINYIEVDNNEKAKTVLERIKKDYSSTIYLTSADRYLALIK